MSSKARPQSPTLDLSYAATPHGDVHRFPRTRSPKSTSPNRSASPSSPLPVLRAISHEDTSLPGLPPYEKIEQPDEWLERTMWVYRYVKLIYNPNHLSAGVTTLNERLTGTAPGLGVYEIVWFSDVVSVFDSYTCYESSTDGYQQWTKSGPLQTRLTLPSLDPRVTIFYIRTILIQTHTIRSPRDDLTVSPISSQRQLTVIEMGKRPPAQHEHPSKDIPALWRGVEAGGKDRGEDGFMVEKIGRLIPDALVRPSTLPG